MKRIYTDVYAVIAAYIARNGYAPTITEIASAFGISHNAARKRVLWLTACGLLTYAPRRSRGIALTGAIVYRVCKCGRPVLVKADRKCARCVARRKVRYEATYRTKTRQQRREYDRQRYKLVKLERFQERIAA